MTWNLFWKGGISLFVTVIAGYIYSMATGVEVATNLGFAIVFFFVWIGCIIILERIFPNKEKA